MEGRDAREAPRSRPGPGGRSAALLGGLTAFRPQGARGRSHHDPGGEVRQRARRVEARKNPPPRGSPGRVLARASRRPVEGRDAREASDDRPGPRRPLSGPPGRFNGLPMAWARAAGPGDRVGRSWRTRKTRRGPGGPGRVEGGIPAMTDFRAKGTIMGLAGLTAVFGMGTGGAPPVWSPGKRPAGGQARRPRCWLGGRSRGQARCVVGGRGIDLRGVDPVGSGIVDRDHGRARAAPDRGPAGGCGGGSGWSSRSAVRTGRLRRSPAVHSRPIDLVVFQEPSQP